MVEPLVSVVIAACNQAQHLPQALESLRRQTLAAHQVQVIAVNDGSQDGTGQILRGCDWIDRIERENRGLTASCNEGLERARGRYLARLDSDDSAEPDWLEALVNVLEQEPQAACVVPDRWEGDGDTWHRVRPDPQNLYSLIACGTLFRTSDVRGVGGFRPLYWEEYDLYLRLRPRGRFARLERPLYRYRRHSGGMTSDDERRRLGWRELVEIWGADTLRSAGVSRELEQEVRCIPER